MLRTLFLFAVSSVLASGTCQDLGKSVAIRGSEKELSVSAGKKFLLPFSIEIVDYDRLATWDGNVSLKLRFQNKIQGSRAISLHIPIQTEGEFEKLPAKIEAKVRPNMGGDYSFSAQIEAFDSHQEGVSKGTYCLEKIAAPSLLLKVDNTIEGTDINPPVITKISFDKANYAVTETAKLAIQFQDKSRLCRFEALCPLSAPLFVEIQNTKTEAKHRLLVDSSDFLMSPHEPGEAILRLRLNRFRKPLLKGTYRVSFLQIEDIHGNLSTSIPNDKAFFSVTGLD